MYVDDATNGAVVSDGVVVERQLCRDVFIRLEPALERENVPDAESKPEDEDQDNGLVVRESSSEDQAKDRNQ